MSSPVPLPRGATNASTSTAAAATSAPTARGSPRRSPRAAADISAPSAKPTWNTTHVMRITPPTRAMPASGPSAWAMPRLASGTPPNGNENRSASTRLWAAGRPITPQRPGGATSSATPCQLAKSRLVTM